jgi:hypothetical protein
MNQQTPSSSPTVSGPIRSESVQDSSPAQQPAPLGPRLAAFPPSAADGKETPNQSPSPSRAQNHTQSAAPGKTASPSPCAHFFPSGRHCRRLVSPSNSRFCSRHAKLPENLQPDDLTPELTADPEYLDSLDGIYNFLCKLAVLLARNRISTRRAAVLAYINSQLLHAFAATRREEAAIRREQAEAPFQITDDLPRPNRD